MMGKVSVPSDVSSPSAMVFGFTDGMIFPSFIERYASSAISGSAAMTRMPGLVPFAAMDVPLAEFAAADGGNDHIQVWDEIKQLECRCALSWADDVFVVIRMDDGLTCLSQPDPLHRGLPSPRASARKT